MKPMKRRVPEQEEEEEEVLQLSATMIVLVTDAPAGEGGHQKLELKRMCDRC